MFLRVITILCQLFFFLCCSLSAFAQVPSNIPDLVLWLDATDVNANGSVVVDGTLISTWVDKTGNGGDATEPNAAAQPTLTYGAFNCLPGLYFDNLSQGLQGQINRPNGQEYTLIFFGQMGTSNAGARNAYMELSASGRSILFQTHVWPTVLSTPLNLGVAETIRWTETSNGNFSLYEDGVANTVDASRPSSWNLVGQTTVDYHLADDRTGGDELEDGYINEILFYDRILTPQEISDVENYLTDKWQNFIPCVPAIMKANKTVALSNPSNYYLPGEEIIYSITISNDGGPYMDDDTLFIVDSLPDNITFNSGDFSAANSGMGPVEFTAGGTGLTFDPATDFGTSFGTVKPTNLAECTDTPNGGLDDQVSYICLSPKGKTANEIPSPEALFRFKGRIK